MQHQWIDGHLDLAYLAVNGRDMRTALEDPAVGCVTLPALREAGVNIVFGTIFTEPGETNPDQPHIYDRNDSASAERAGLLQLDQYEQWEREGEITIVRRREDLDRDAPLPKVVILMEGADSIRSPSELPMWFERGLRFVGLTWATGTRYAGGNASQPGQGPVTELGAELIAALDSCGIVHDVSHLSDAAFDDLLRLARGRVVATHSNCRALLNNSQRHLRDDQIKTIAERGGIIGLNLYSNFLVRPPAPNEPARRASLAECIAHLQHVRQIVGDARCIALGSDMDGGFGPDHLPAGLDHPAKLHALADALTEAGWTQNDIAAFAHANWLRFLRANLPA